MAESTEVISVRCNHCGAPLTVSPGTRFVTCSYCGSQLAIHQSGGAFYTEVLQDIDQRTQRIEQDVDQIKRQNAIEQLDREWEMQRQTLLVRNKNGSTSVPSIAGGVVAAVIAVGFGIFWMIVTSIAGAPFFFPLFGILFIIVGLFASITSIGSASRYQDAETRYQQRRAQLLEEMSMQQGSSPPTN